MPAVRDGRVLVIEKWRHWSDSGILGRARSIDDVLRLVAPDAVAAVDEQADRTLREYRP